MKILKHFAWIMAVVLLFTSLLGGAAVMADEAEYNDLKTFTAKTLDGGEFTNEDLKDYDITIIYFWATYCGYCIDEMPELQEYKEGLPENVQMISICGDGIAYSKLAKEILDDAGFDVVTIIDGDQDLAKLYTKVMYTPTTIFVDSEGHVVGEAIVGAPKDLEATYTEHLNEVLPEEEDQDEQAAEQKEEQAEAAEQDDAADPADETEQK